MNRRTLAICDPEEAYACRLMDALSRREDFPFEVLAFTGAERLQDSLARKPVQILLIAQGSEDKSISLPLTPSKKALIYNGFSAPKA